MPNSPCFTGRLDGVFAKIFSKKSGRASDHRTCLHELNLIEQWGSGIPRIIREAKELGLPELQIMKIGMRLRFIVTLAEQITVQKATEQVRRILDCLKNEPLGARNAMQSIGLLHRPTFLYDYLQPAMDAGLVEMTQPKSPDSERKT